MVKSPVKKYLIKKCKAHKEHVFEGDYCCLEEFVLKNGRSCETTIPLPSNIKKGKEIVAQGKIFAINPDVIAEDAVELGYRVINLKNILSALLEEVTIGHYVGGHPPLKSYEFQIKDSELFEFKWKCKRFGCDVYLKYCLKEEIFYLVSLHKNRP